MSTRSSVERRASVERRVTPEAAVLKEVGAVAESISKDMQVAVDSVLKEVPIYSARVSGEMRVTAETAAGEIAVVVESHPTPSPPPNRWLIVFGTALVQIGVGSFYAWSQFNTALSDYLGIATTNATGALVASPSVIFTFSLGCLALSLSTLGAGPLVMYFGIRPVVFITGFVYGAAIVIAAFSVNTGMLWVFAGFILGAADGVAYITTLSNCIKWFPERTGLVSGIAVACYGLGSFFFKYINQLVASGNLVSGVVTSSTVVKTFIAWGCIGGGLVVVGSVFLKDAPLRPAVKAVPEVEVAHSNENSHVPGQVEQGVATEPRERPLASSTSNDSLHMPTDPLKAPRESVDVAKTDERNVSLHVRDESTEPEERLSESKTAPAQEVDKKNFMTLEVIKTPQYYMMFITVFTGSLAMWFVGAGITTIGATKTGLDAQSTMIVNVVAFCALANVVGRFGFGTLSDKVGRKAVFFMTFIAMLAMVLLTLFTPNGKMNIGVFYLVALLVAACFGGNITVFPTWAGDYFGLKNHQRNYPLIYQGFGLASIVAGLIYAEGDPLHPPKVGNLDAVLWTMGSLTVVVLVILVIIRAPKKK